jgi:hypothetical protein
LTGNGLSLESGRGGDPYASSGPMERKPSGTRSGTTTKTDLRKLSEWIKMMRDMEARKLRAECDPDDEE